MKREHLIDYLEVGQTIRIIINHTVIGYNTGLKNNWNEKFSDKITLRSCR